jgi:VanZ family protein
MPPSKKLRARYWLYVLGFVGLIYSTLYIVRPICTYLKAATPFSLLVNILCIVVLILLGIGIGMKIRIQKLSSYVILSMVLLVYIYGLAVLQYPEEKIHLIEYGFLAYLVIKAIRVDVSKPIAYGYAFILVSVIGWIDEGIQYLLPNRYYQIEDVILNSVSGALGLFLVFILNREQRKPL